MAIASDILTNARYIMNDKDKHRWTDARLLVLLDDAQKDIAIKANLLIKKYSVPLIDGTSEYTLPTDTYKIVKAVWRGEEIPLTTYDDMNVYDNDWLADTTTQNLTNIIYNYRNKRNIRVYPIPTDLADIKLEEYNTISDAFASIDSKYGIIGSIDTSNPESVYGLVTLVQQEGVTYPYSFDDLYGLVGDLVDNENIGSDLLYMYYIKIPDTLTSVSSEIEIDQEFHRLLSMAVAGNALRDDNDASNLQRGVSIYQEYMNEVQLLAKDSAKNFTTGNLMTRYNGGFS